MAPPRISPKVRLMQRVEMIGDCWIYTGSRTSDGYGVMGIGRGKQYRAHRVSYEVHVGPIPTGLQVCHRCDEPLCVNPAHLFVGTARDNCLDMHAKGRGRRLHGEDHPGAKLRNADVPVIKALRQEGHTLASIGTRFGVSFQLISDICRGKAWTSSN